MKKLDRLEGILRQFTLGTPLAPTVTIEEFARRAGVQVDTVRRWDAAGKLPRRVRRGHRLNYVRDDADAWFAARDVK